MPELNEENMIDITRRLNDLLEEGIKNQDLSYFLDKAHFVQDVYFTYGDYDSIFENVSRWQVMRVWNKENGLINKTELGNEKYEALMLLLDEAKDSI